jgi:hypothetical protein
MAYASIRPLDPAGVILAGLSGGSPSPQQQSADRGGRSATKKPWMQQRQQMLMHKAIVDEQEAREKQKGKQHGG